jgi:hypothetical protein
MSKLLTKILLVVAAAMAPVGLAQAQAQGPAQAAMQILAAGCTADARKFCSNVPSGGGRIIACLKQNQPSLSDQCKQAAAQASKLLAGGNQGASAATPTSPTPSMTPQPSPSPSNSPVAAPRAPSSAAATKPAAKAAATASAAASASGGKKPATSSGSYLVMKKVQITGPGPDTAHPTQPAYDLLIPSTWTMQGTMRMGASPSGCFSDTFSISLKATSADGSTWFSTGPDYSWQYADDPTVLKNLNDPNLRALGPGGKPCPVAKPMKAEDYFRQNVLKVFPSGTTVVSVAPFPQLNEIVRRRLGLPPGDGATGATRTEAVRIRLAYQESGKDVESWVALAVVVNIYPAGRGSFYDSDAMSLVQLVAPKGKLDANDQLFQVIISSMQPEPQWVSYSNGFIAKLNQMQAQKVSNINQQWSAFYNHAATVINGETQNMMKGAAVSTFHADQLTRGVQTFVDPATGKTQELSNLYDHAWQNGSGDYVLSNDASFNPNQQLSGNWSELKPVNP